MPDWPSGEFPAILRSSDSSKGWAMTLRKHLAAGLVVALGLIAGQATAQSTGGKQLRIIVPFPPGGTADILTRLVGQEAVKALGTTLLVENRPGGGTVIAT